MPAKKKSTRSERGSVGRDRVVSGGDGSVVIGGDVNHSFVITGDQNRITIASRFKEVYQKVEGHPTLSPTDKADLKSELETFEAEDKKGPESNEGFLAQRLRNVKRIAPDILEVAMATIANPAAGFGMIAKKVADKMKVESAQTATK